MNQAGDDLLSRIADLESRDAPDVLPTHPQHPSYLLDGEDDAAATEPHAEHVRTAAAISLS